MEGHYVIGIDGGGTKTASVILDSQGHVIGSGESGPSTFGVVPSEITQSSIAEAVMGACRSGGLPVSKFSAAFLGLGNVVSDIDRSIVRQMAADLELAPFDRIGVDHDCRIALAGALSGRPGIVLIAGTGTSCFGMNAQGDSWRSGGWGPLIDDEGSSYWLGLQAMRAAVLEFDGRGPSTLLTRFIYEKLQLRDMNELMNRLYASGMIRTEIAALSPYIFEAAAQEDTVARQLIRRGCQSMADSVLAVAQKLGLDQNHTELAIVGGLTNAGNTLLHSLAEAIHARLPQCEIKPAELSPALGAALLALQLTGQRLNEQILANIHLEAKKHKDHE
jgi:N-acetylglucosamine kinase-like BadF-type ATPase